MQILKPTQVTKTQSLVLMKNMIRISISSICYMRDLFPKECFKNQPYGNIDIHQLRGAEKDNKGGEVVVTNKEAFLLTQWIEKGVFTALQLEYLSSMIFAIYSTHPLTKENILLETYEFRVSYQSDEPAKINDVSLTSKDALKLQAGRFIRSLTEFTGTLDEIPNERWITIQLRYKEHTPADYEPEYFKASTDSVLASQALPLKVKLGAVKTAQLEMTAKFAGLESLLFEDLCKVASKSTEQVVTPISSFRGKHFTAGSASNFEQEKQSVLMETEKRAKLIEESDYEKVRDFIVNEGSANVKECVKYLDIETSRVIKSFERLVENGVIKQRGKGFEVKNPLEQLSKLAMKPKDSFDEVPTQPQMDQSPIRYNEKNRFPSTPQKAACRLKFDNEGNEESNIDDTQDFDENFAGRHIHRTPSKPPLKVLRRTSEIAIKPIKPIVQDKFATPSFVKKESADLQDEIALTQSTDMSETKKRKYSIIADPLHLIKEKRGQ